MGGLGHLELARTVSAAQAPHPALRPLLARDYRAFADVTEPSGEFVLPATAAVPLILKIHDSALRPPAFVAGAHRSYTVVQGPCAPSYLEVWLAPVGAYTLLGLPMDELSGNGQFVDLVDVFGARGRRVAGMVRDAPTWAERFALMDEFLLRQGAEGPRPSPVVAWAWRQIVSSGGNAAIGALAADAGWSHKHLIAKFKQQIGLTPKTVARLVRFEGVLRRMGRTPAARCDELAADSGYADQAHLVREFREFTGTTPTDFRRTTDNTPVNFVQDEAVATA